MVITTHEIIGLLETWLWPFFRIMGLFMVAPIIGTRSVPVRIRLVMAIAITIVIVPVIPPPPYIDPFSSVGVLTSIQQVMIGLAMGFTLRAIFVVVEIGGQAIGQLMGLMMASMVDPQNGNQVPIIGQFYLLLATLLFLSVDGHLVMINALANSFHSLPVGSGSISRDVIWDFLVWIGTVFSTAVLIALPVIVSMLIVNLSFGVMGRSAPQLNIFAVGFPVMIIVGMLIIMFTLTNFVPHMLSLFDDAFVMMKHIAS
jgi:flagellar biosynthetic protein FliR